MRILPPLLSRRALLAAAPALLVPRLARSAPSLTPSATEGPFYPTAIPVDDDSDLVRVEDAVREAGGDILYLAGRALDRGARPVAGLRIEIWQCDAHGVYLHPDSRDRAKRDGGFQGFGRGVSDAAGAFSFRTIVPVPYPGRTPHIHVKVFDGASELLTTQLYIAGHPQNASDRLFGRLSPEQQQSVSMVLAPRVDAVRPSFETTVHLVLAA